MKTIAIVVGVSNYGAQTSLPCCHEDVAAIKALLDSTCRFDVIETIVDPNAETLKCRLREVLELSGDLCREVFFYFSGHGHEADGIFYFCTSDFSARQPNVTGLSGPDLHNLLRCASPEMVTIVIDACHSGSPLIKREGPTLPLPKGEFSNFLQIASCLRSQISVTGEPLSDFTEAFCVAATRKQAGPVFYTDINAALRDHYLDDEERNPHFVSQMSGRELFVAEAQSLTPFREQFEARWRSKLAPSLIPEADASGLPEASATGTAVIVPEAPSSLLEMLISKEEKIAKPDQVKQFIGQLFDGLIKGFGEIDLSELFDMNNYESTNYDDRTPRAFMTRILSKEERSDEFVTATVKRHRKKRSQFDLATWAFTALYNDDDWIENYDLNLNIHLDRAQIVVILTPRFMVLQKFVITISCAPSLEHCYVFASCIRLARTDWDSFADEGPEVIREWFEADWSKSPNWIVDGLIKRLQALLQAYVSSLTTKLQGAQ